MNEWFKWETICVFQTNNLSDNFKQITLIGFATELDLNRDRMTDPMIAQQY